MNATSASGPTVWAYARFGTQCFSAFEQEAESDSWQAIRSVESSPSRHSAKATGLRLAVSWMAVRPVWSSQSMTSSTISIGASQVPPRHVTQRQESDTVEILSGVFEGKTTGTPIALLIRNEDARSRDYGNLIDTFRPGHADYTYWQKYGIRDHRGGGRASARETAVRVAAAAIAKKWLREKYGVVIRGYLSQLGPLEAPFKSWGEVSKNPFFSSKLRGCAEA